MINENNVKKAATALPAYFRDILYVDQYDLYFCTFSMLYAQLYTYNDGKKLARAKKEERQRVAEKSNLTYL